MNNNQGYGTAQGGGFEMDTVDPVCGMTVSETSDIRTDYQGRVYAFCSSRCLDKFRKDPELYLKQSPAERAVVAEENAVYTCPMHPEIVQNHFGFCPKCGMALEPLTTALKEDNPELTYLTRRLWISGSLALPVFILAMIADMVPGLLPESLSMRTVQWIEFILGRLALFRARLAIAGQPASQHVYPDWSGGLCRLGL